MRRVFLPPIILEYLAHAAERFCLDANALREVITAGEPLRITSAIRRLFQRLGACSLINQYGPTEAHVVTAWTGNGGAEAWPRVPPIGRTINNARIYFLDGHLEPVPVRVPGELFIGGKCLARGYLNRPELTA